MSFTLTRGHVPLLVSFPHSGTGLPSGFAATLSEHARSLPDTDWLVPELYAMLRDLGAWTLQSHMSRYVIDLNRDPGGASLYPGQSTTSLCPIDTFDGKPIYLGEAPDRWDIEARRKAWFDPYHRVLAHTLDALRARFGHVLLWDAHSIRSQVPRFFDGTLPALNLGTARGTSCAPAVRDTVSAALASASFDSVVDGRFVGGFITRHYGRPDAGVHAVQLEIAQAAYMHETGEPRFKPIARRALAATLERALVAGLACVETLV